MFSFFYKDGFEEMYFLIEGVDINFRYFNCGLILEVLKNIVNKVSVLMDKDGFEFCFWEGVIFGAGF